MMDRRTFLLGTVGVAGAVALGGCSGGSDSASSTSSSLAPGQSPGEIPPAPRPTLRLAGGDFGLPSPFTYSRGPGYWQMSYLYDTLLWKDSSGEFLPWLARDYQRSDDGLTYVFQLRDDVQWSDGRPLTADDVVFTFEYFASQQLSPQIIVRPEGVESATAINTHEVEIRLNRPVVTFLRSVAGAVPIVPRHIWSSVANASMASDPALLVGSGPYRLDSYSRGEGAYLFTAKDDYFLGTPFVERIESRPVGDELTALLAGELDAGDPPARGAGSEALAPFRNDPSFGVLEGGEDSTVGLYWNLAQGGVLADVRFRRACARALDRGDMVERLIGGNGEPGNPGFLPPGHAFHADVEQYPFDVDAANRLLDDAGYRRNGDVRQGPDGQPLRFDLLVTNDPVPPVSELIVRGLQAIGVEIAPQAVDRPTHDSRTSGGEYEMAITSYGGLGGDPDYMREVYSSRIPRRFQSTSGYSNIDGLAERQLVTFDDGERRRLVNQMQETVATDIPM
ncbi:MAG: twin-arginine translocation signal domain-containing protein, partial [Acidimicrobiia bacterium]|nr:twin-arginine translocation signal domain-containing protein [Acidimicrobiia bacterium]